MLGYSFFSCLIQKISPQCLDRHRCPTKYCYFLAIVANVVACFSSLLPCIHRSSRCWRPPPVWWQESAQHHDDTCRSCLTRTCHCVWPGSPVRRRHEWPLVRHRCSWPGSIRTGGVRSTGGGDPAQRSQDLRKSILISLEPGRSIAKVVLLLHEFILEGRNEDRAGEFSPHELQRKGKENFSAFLM
jgi:hypothetical protein